MRYRIFAGALLALAAASPILAANNFVVKDGTATAITKCSVQQSDGSQADCNVLKNSAGATVDPATAQGIAATQAAAGSNATLSHAVQGIDGGKPIPISGRTDSLALVAGNTAAAAQAAVGGRYVAGAVCSTWVANGITIRFRGPDGSTMLPLAQYSANSSAVVDVAAGGVLDAVVTSGSAACNVTLARVPQ